LLVKFNKTWREKTYNTKKLLVALVVVLAAAQRAPKTVNPPQVAAPEPPQAPSKKLAAAPVVLDPVALQNKLLLERQMDPRDDNGTYPNYIDFVQSMQWAGAENRDPYMVPKDEKNVPKYRFV
jgi:hypothetical protein